MIALRIFEVVRRLNQEGISILLVEQAARMALQLAHRGYVMERGQITISGAAQDLLVIGTPEREVLFPFVSALVPQVDVTGGRVVIDDRPGLLGEY